MRIVITGATGFLGGRLCRHLAAQGHEIVALGRDRQKGAHLAETGIRFVASDLARRASLDALALIGPVDAVVHCAALSSAWGPRAAFMAANVDATDTALLLAERLEAARFIQISSPSVLFRFEDQIGVNETVSLPKPVNFYAETKALAEARVMAAPHLNPLILRPRGIYGPGDVALLPRLMRAAARGPLPLLRGGMAQTDLTHVDDVIAAIAAALAAQADLKNRIYHICGGEPLPIRQIIEMTAKAADIPVRWRSLPVSLALGLARLAETASRLRPGQPEPVITAYGMGVLSFSQTLDISAAAKDLGFHPKISFAMGLETVKDAL